MSDSRNTSGSVSLGEVAERLSVLEVACSKCDRHGRYPLATLIERYGRHLALPDLRIKLAADCDNHDAAEYSRCDVYFPELGRSTAPG